MKLAAVALAVLTLTGCTALKKTAPSDLPVISQFIASPASGKAPLSFEFKVDVTGAERCEILGIGVVACSGAKAWSVSATTDFTLTVRNGRGESVSQVSRVTITP